jgi:hypothetical protein
MMRRLMYLILGVMALLPAPGSDAQELPILVVTWAEDGVLYFWQEGDTEPRAIGGNNAGAPQLSPNGQRIAFKRSAITATTATGSLWVVNIDGTGEQQLYAAAPDMVGQIEWLDNDTLLFNTIHYVEMGLLENNDLLLADITTTQVDELFPAGEGGQFHIGPEGQITLVRSGSYQGDPGTIHYLTTPDYTLIDLLSYPSVATASEYPFYADIHWINSTTLLTAIPAPDLVYHEDALDEYPTRLYRLTMDGMSEEIGTVPASFFGPPRWSADGAYVTFLQRTGTAADLTFELWLAAGDGTGAERYDLTQQSPVWTSGSARFLYPHAGSIWLGAPGSEPVERVAQGSMLLLPTILARGDESILIYVRLIEETMELVVAGLEGEATAFASVSRPVSFHARLINP